MSANLSKVKEAYFQKLFGASLEPNNARSTSLSPPRTKPRVLLLDKHTTPIVSMCYTQSQLLANDVILIELVENYHQLSSMKHLDCIVYINPCQESIKYACQELRNPHFGQYQLFLSNCINKNQLESIAEADQYEVIEKVVELFQDYLIVNHNLYVVDTTYLAVQTNPVLLESEKLTSLLLALKRTPMIKYESNSIDLKRLSSEILYQINSNSNNNLFDDLNRNSDTPPLLVLLDRKNDPITPLVTPWTYQSMIHEFMTIHKNVVQVAEEGASQIVISEENDPFFQESMYLNYGDLTEKFQKYVEKYKSETKQSSIENLKSSNLSELKKVLTKFPEFRKFSTNVLTHLNLIGEIDKQISAQHLWELGELQQTITCELENQQTVRNSVLEVLDNAEGKRVSTVNKIKLVLLYSFRHNNPTDLSLFLQKLNNPELTSPLPTEAQIQLLKRFRTLFNANSIADQKRLHEQNEGLTNIFTNKKIGINGLFNRDHSNQSKSDNIYMQYTPRLNEILAGLINPTQKQQDLLGLSTLVPDKVKQQYGSAVINEPVHDIIIYIKGGVTYEEARLAYELSESNKRINLIIGGDLILNSGQWLDKMCSIASSDKDSLSEGSVNVDRQTQLRDIL